MTSKTKGKNSPLFFGILSIVLGGLTITAKGFTTGIGGDWVILSKEGSLVLGLILIVGGSYLVLLSLKKFLKSRRS